MLKKEIIKIVILGLSAVFFSGCASMQALSSYARTGDTITVALGGTEDSNALVDVLKKENIEVSITDVDGNTYPVKLRKLFKVHADYASEYIHRTNMTSGSYVDYAPPLTGQWLAIIDLVDPVSGEQPVLSVGPATISVSSPVQLQRNFLYKAAGTYFPWSNGNLASISVEILPGTGAPNNLNYIGPVRFDPVDMLEPLSQIIVSPNGTPAAPIAGGEFKFLYTKADFSTQLTVAPIVHDPNIQISSELKDLGDGTIELHVLIMNPKGFLINNNRTPANSVEAMGIGKMSPYKSLKFSLAWGNIGGTSIVTDANWQNSIQMSSGYYVDRAGNKVAEINPAMNKAR